MRRFGVMLIIFGLALFLAPVMKLEFMSWAGWLDQWGSTVGTIVKSVVVMLGMVMALSSGGRE